MKIMEKFGVPEPQWILDRAESGPLFWRRDATGNKPRVKFLCEVDVKEFYRADHEMEDIETEEDIHESNDLVAVMIAFFCIAFTVILPWYVIGVN